jgi:hypothetical protein
MVRVPLSLIDILEAVAAAATMAIRIESRKWKCQIKVQNYAKYLLK